MDMENVGQIFLDTLVAKVDQIREATENSQGICAALAARNGRAEREGCGDTHVRSTSSEMELRSSAAANHCRHGFCEGKGERLNDRLNTTATRSFTCSSKLNGLFFSQSISGFATGVGGLT